jgi:hypothetical protein
MTNQQFYSYWADVIDQMPNDILEETVRMINSRQQIGIQEMLRNELRYRNQMEFIMDNED